MEFYVLMSLLFSFFFFLPLLFRSMAGLIQCPCLEALVLQRIIKMPNSLKEIQIYHLEKKKKKTLFFCIIPEMQGHKQMRLVQC